MRISDWSSDVCSSDLSAPCLRHPLGLPPLLHAHGAIQADGVGVQHRVVADVQHQPGVLGRSAEAVREGHLGGEVVLHLLRHVQQQRSEEHTSELQSLMRISYAVFCLKKKTHSTPCDTIDHKHTHIHTRHYNATRSNDVN